MKGTKVSRLSTQNEGALEVLYNQTYQKIMDYINQKEDVAEDSKTISAYSLYSILKSYYDGLDIAMSTESSELKELIEKMNNYIANGYTKVVNIKKSNKLAGGITKLFDKIKESKQVDVMNKRYLNLRFYIRRDTTSAVFDVLDENKYKKVIINRDVSSQEIYYGEHSMEDYEVIDFAYDKLISLFDIIDSYRSTLPEQIDADLVLDDYACRPYEYAKYSAPIASDIITGEIFVNSNGYVDFAIDLTRENNRYHYIDSYSKSLKELIREKSIDLLKKISIDVESLQEPIRGVVKESIANNRNYKKHIG